MKTHNQDNLALSIENTEHNMLMSLLYELGSAKQAVKDAESRLREVENALLATKFISNSLKDIGTTTFFGGALKVTTKNYQKWNQDVLVGVIKSNDWPIMPFEIEYKPVSAKLKVLRDERPDLYMKLVEALIETPAKPYFQVKGESS